VQVWFEFGYESVVVVLVVERDVEVGVHGRDTERNVHCVSALPTLDGARLPEVAIHAQLAVDADLDTEFLASNAARGVCEFLSLVESTTRPEPLAFHWLVRPSSEEDAPLVLEDNFDTALGHLSSEFGEEIVWDTAVVDTHDGLSA
jgi:hypothetical protein